MSPDNKGKTPEGEFDEGMASQEDIDALLKSAGEIADDPDAMKGGKNPLADQDLESLLARVDSMEAPSEKPTPVRLDELPASPGAPATKADHLSMLMNVTLNMKVELGRSRMYLEDVLKLGEGSVVELEKLAGDPLDILVNEKLVARGEILVLNDNFCIRVTEIISPKGAEGAKGGKE